MRYRWVYYGQRRGNLVRLESSERIEACVLETVFSSWREYKIALVSDVVEHPGQVLLPLVENCGRN